MPAESSELFANAWRKIARGCHPSVNSAIWRVTWKTVLGSRGRCRKDWRAQSERQPTPGPGPGRHLPGFGVKPVLGAVAVAIAIAGLFSHMAPLPRASPGARPVRSIADKLSPMTQFQLALPSWRTAGGHALGLKVWRCQGMDCLLSQLPRAWARSRSLRRSQYPQRIGGGGTHRPTTLSSSGNGEWLAFWRP